MKPDNDILRTAVFCTVFLTAGGMGCGQSISANGLASSRGKAWSWNDTSPEFPQPRRPMKTAWEQGTRWGKPIRASLAGSMETMPCAPALAHQESTNRLSMKNFTIANPLHTLILLATIGWAGVAVSADYLLHTLILLTIIGGKLSAQNNTVVLQNHAFPLVGLRPSAEESLIAGSGPTSLAHAELLLTAHNLHGKVVREETRAVQPGEAKQALNLPPAGYILRAAVQERVKTSRTMVS